MAAQLGQVAYIHLSDQFRAPRWREGLVIAVRRNWIRLVVRAVDAAEVVEGLSKLEHESQTFFLLECPVTHLRAACAEPVLKLETSTAELMTQGKDLIASDSDLVFATASDPEPPSRRRAARPKSSSSSSSSSSDDGELRGTLAQIQKNWQGLDTKRGKSS